MLFIKLSRYMIMRKIALGTLVVVLDRTQHNLYIVMDVVLYDLLK